MRKFLIIQICVLFSLVGKSQTWTSVGPSGSLSSWTSSYVSMVLDGSKNPIIAYSDNASYSSSVKRWSGSAWSFIGSTYVPNRGGSYCLECIGVNNNGNPMIAGSGPNSVSSIMGWNGSSWISYGIPDGYVAGPHFAVNNNGMIYIQYIGYMANSSTPFKFYKWNGSSWANISPTTNIPHNTASLYLDGSGNPYFAYLSGTNLLVQRYTGSSWVALGSVVTNSSTGDISMVLDQSDKPVIAYSDNSNGNKATVKRWDGSAWQLVGNAGFSTSTVTLTERSLALDASGNPLVFFADGANSNGATVMQWTGSGWYVLGSTNFSGGAISSQSISVDASGNVYTSYSKSGGVYVMKNTLCKSPAITSQPTSQTVCEGNSASFSVSATGDGLTYLWSNGANTSSINTTLSGNYTVTVTGNCGSVVSNTVALNVNPATKILTQPVSQAVCSGNTALLSVSASGTGTLNYSWTNGGNTNSKSTTSAGAYTVTVSGTCGSIISNPATVSINSAPSISSQPINKTVCPNSTAQFSVSASGSGSLTYLWSNGANSNNLITSVLGNYVVTVTGSCGKTISNPASLTNYQNTILLTQPTSQTILQGSNATLSVSATGSNLTYQWNNGNVNASFITTSPGIYAATVSGSCGTVNSSFANVIVTPTIIYTGILSDIVGKKINLSATVGSNASPSFSIISGGTLASLNNNQLQLNQPGTVIIGISVSSVIGYTSSSIQQNITIVLPITTTLSITNLSSNIVLPGQTITLSGNGFNSVTSILVNNITINNGNFTINSDNSITLNLPTSISGTGISVQVVGAAGASVPVTGAVTTDISQVVSVSTTTGVSTASVTIPNGLPVSEIQTFFREISSTATMTSVAATASGSNYSSNLPTSSSLVGLEYIFQITSNGIPYFTDTSYSYLNYADKVPFTNVVTGNTVDKYAITSQPYTFANNTLGNVFTELGNPDSTKWRMYGFNAATSVYNEFKNTSSGFQLGQGYWILTTLPVTKLNSPATVFTSTKRKPFSYKYAKGWNLIGNPYPFNIVWSDVVNANPTKNLPYYIFTYASGAYTKSAILNKYAGAFIYLQDTATIVFPVLKNPNSGGRLSDIVSDISNYKDENGWNLNIEAKNSHQTFSLAGVGMRKDAAKGLDRYDVPLLPSPKGFLNLHTGNNMLDVVKDTSEYVWHIATNNSGSDPIEISWDLPSALPLYLKDRISGIQVNMQKQSSFRLYSPQSGFDIVYGENEVNPSEWVKFQPNPAKDYLIIRHELNDASTLVFELLDLSGKRVYTETWLTQAGVGEHVVNISSFTSGVYITKLSSTSFNYVEKINIQP